MNHRHQLVLVRTLIVCSLALLLTIAGIHLSIGQAVFNNAPEPADAVSALAIDHPPIHSITLNAISNSVSLSLQLKTQLNLIQLLPRAPHSILRWFIRRSPHSTVSLHRPIYLYITHPNNHSSSSSDPFVQINFLDSFKLPLSCDHPSQKQPLDTISHLNLLVQILSPHQLNAFINQTLVHRVCHLRVSIQHVGVQLDADRFSPWLSNIIQSLSQINLRGLALDLDLKLPDELPPILDRPSDVISVDDYSFYPIPPLYNTSRNVTDDLTTALIGIRASASIPNPVLDLKKYSSIVDTNVPIKWRIPLLIYRNSNASDPGDDRKLTPDEPEIETLMATALSIPFNLSNHEDRLTVPIEGSLLPSLARLPHSGPLSDFLNEFLKGRPNNLTIRYHHPHLLSKKNEQYHLEKGEEITWLNPVDHQQLVLVEPRPVVLEGKPTGDDLHLPVSEIEKIHPTPTFITEFLKKNLRLKIKFPGISTKEINLIKRIEIQEMKINILSIINREIKCSGKLVGVLNLPNPLKTLSNYINITEILPNVILLDGRLPNEYTNQTQKNHQQNQEEEEYPSNAFGRLDLQEYIPATLIIVPNNDSSSTSSNNNNNINNWMSSNSSSTRVELHAQFTQVPLQILDGRFNVFRKYATKYLLHHKSNPQKLDNDDDALVLEEDGVLTSILGTFRAIGSLLNSFSFSFIDVSIFGSFFV